MDTNQILTMSLFFVSVAAIFSLMPNFVLAQGDLTSKKVILDPNDYNGLSVNLGWEPNGSYDTFRITDLSVSPIKSTVNVNVVQDTDKYGTLVCSVDQLIVGGFEVACNNPPDYDAVLHYTVLNNANVESSGPAFLGQDVESLVAGQNLTAGFSAGGFSSTNSTMNSTAVD
jgi:hypothetical protein